VAQTSRAVQNGQCWLPRTENFCARALPCLCEDTGRAAGNQGYLIHESNQISDWLCMNSCQNHKKTQLAFLAMPGTIKRRRKPPVERWILEGGGDCVVETSRINFLTSVGIGIVSLLKCRFSVGSVSVSGLKKVVGF
jgi:hypothetical protein